MAESTGIAWTDATFNPWTGCIRVSPGCDNCYAEVMSRRNSSTFGSWTPGASRKRTSAAYWKGPIKWNRDAERAAKRARVFCASMADVFDNKAPNEWRADLWALIRATPWLQWQLLTKRPQNIAGMVPPDWGHGFHNVWLGTTAENQAEADRRIPHLLRVPATVRFLSCEPLLGPVEIGSVIRKSMLDGTIAGSSTHPIAWVIVGGESGGGARSMQRAWAESILSQCEAAGVAAFFKQAGSKRGPDWPASITGKGDDPAQWPGGSFVQQFPAGAPDA